MDFFKDKDNDNEVYAVFDERTWATFRFNQDANGASDFMIHFHRLPFNAVANNESDVSISESEFSTLLNHGKSCFNALIQTIRL